jgi:hypothetical protein
LDDRPQFRHQMPKLNLVIPGDVLQGAEAGRHAPDAIGAQGDENLCGFGEGFQDVGDMSLWLDGWGGSHTPSITISPECVFALAQRR